MRTVSTGLGLCVLGFCVLGATALSSPHLGAKAFAESPTAARMVDHPTDPNGLQAAADHKSSPASCENPAQSWFNPTPRYFSTCSGDITREVSTLPFYSADVNSDGITEFFDASADQIGIQAGDSTLKIFRERIDVSSGSAQQMLDVVFEVDQSILTAIRNSLPDPSGAKLRIRSEYAYQTWGWRDCDGDGDLDIVFSVIVINSPGAAPRQVWFENTGYQSTPPPNPYDLDQNGEVGASDISVLLLNFD